MDTYNSVVFHECKKGSQGTVECIYASIVMIPSLECHQNEYDQLLLLLACRSNGHLRKSSQSLQLIEILMSSLIYILHSCHHNCFTFKVLGELSKCINALPPTGSGILPMHKCVTARQRVNNKSLIIFILATGCLKKTVLCFLNIICLAIFYHMDWQYTL